MMARVRGNGRGVSVTSPVWPQRGGKGKTTVENPHSSIEHLFDTMNSVSVALETYSIRPAALVARSASVLPVAEEMAALFPEGGLMRGQTVLTRGPASRSLALAVVARGVAIGAWLAVLDMPELSPEALHEIGVPLHRVVAVSTGTQPADVLAAVFDGFEVVIMPALLYRGALARRVAQRIRAKGVCLVLVDTSDVGAASGSTEGIDAELNTSEIHWRGIGWGTGRLMARHLVVHRSGRRMPRPVTTTVQLPADMSREDHDLSAHESATECHLQML
jgi:hypothetical protein